MSHRYIYTLILLVLGLTASAQEAVNRQITVERIVVPEQRAAIRPLIMPTLLQPRLPHKALQYADYSAAATLTPSLAFSEPVAWADTLTSNPYRGYVRLGYLPAYNLGASLGFRMVNTRNTLVDVWGQFDGQKWKSPSREGQETLKYLDNTVAVGVNLYQLMGTATRLGVGVDYSLTHVNQPGSLTSAGDALAFNVSNVGLRAGIDGIYQALRYGLKAQMGYTAWGERCPLAIKQLSDLREMRLGFGGNAGYVIGDNGGVAGVEVDATLVRNNCQGLLLADSIGYQPWLSDTARTRGLIRFAPYYTLRNQGLTLRLGARIDLSIHGGKSLHVAPDVMVAYEIARVVNVHASATGGEVLNSAYDAWQQSHQYAPGFSSTFSHSPYQLSGGITIGQIQGFSLQLDASYAKVNDWLAPASLAFANATGHGTLLCPVPQDIKGWLIEARASYQWRNIGRLSAYYSAAPSSEDKAWHLWRDRARWIAGGELTVSPISTVDVTVGYEYRSGRQGLVIDGDDQHLAPLGIVGNLNLQAQWRITPQLTAQVNIYNLANRRYLAAPGVDAPGTNGLIGISFKF